MVRPGLWTPGFPEVQSHRVSAGQGGGGGERGSFSLTPRWPHAQTTLSGSLRSHPPCFITNPTGPEVLTCPAYVLRRTTRPGIHSELRLNPPQSPGRAKEVQRGECICPRSHSQHAVKPGPGPRYLTPVQPQPRSRAPPPTPSMALAWGTGKDRIRSSSGSGPAQLSR